MYIEMAYDTIDSLGPVNLKHFDETSKYQEVIGAQEWFSRYEFSYEGRRIMVSFHVFHSHCILDFLCLAQGVISCLPHLQDSIHPRGWEDPSLLS